MKNTLRSLCFIFILVILTNCREEIIVYESPSINIIKIVPTGLTTFDVIVDINKGEGQKLKNARLEIEDITVIGSKNISEQIPLNSEEVQNMTLSINTGRPNHDFLIHAVLVTEQYTYTSEQKIVRLTKNQYSAWFNPDPRGLYANSNEDIGLVVNPGTTIQINVEYDNIYIPNSIKVKLNETFEIESSFDFSPERASYGDNIMSWGTAKIPEDMDAGEYTVDLYIENRHVTCFSKIKVLGGKWEIYENGYPGEKRGNYASFVLGDKLYIVGGNSYATALDYSPVWEYDIPSKQWKQKKNFPHNTPMESGIYFDTEILPYHMQTQSDGYVIVRYSQAVAIWRCDNVNDEWEEIAKYPGLGETGLIAFIFDNYLYVGGGINSNDPTALLVDKPREFFKYNLKTLQWSKLNDLPESLVDGYYFSNCIHEDKIYYLETSRRFWEYSPNDDMWIAKDSFPGPWRMHSKMVSNGENIYLLGGEFYSSGGMFNSIVPLKDSWVYDFNENKWEQEAFLPAYIANGIAFSYENQIYTGMGYIIEDWNYPNNKNQYIYRLNSLD